MNDPVLVVTLLAVAVVLGAIGVVLVAVALARLAALGRAREGLDREVAALATRLEVLKSQGQDLESDLKSELANVRRDQAEGAKALREEVGGRVTAFTSATHQQFDALGSTQRDALGAFGSRLGDFSLATQNAIRDASELQATQARALSERLTTLTKSNDEKLEAIRTNVEQRLDALNRDNTAKLEQMRATVDEKLQATLTDRIGASFKQVSDRLAQVHEGLGEMRTLATGVGDLKRVLTHVKNRGTWGEKALGALLGEVLTPGQFGTNVETVPGSNKRVEFALRMPGGPDDAVVWIPVDAKFPTADWELLQAALERMDTVDADACRKRIAAFVRVQGKTIRASYVAPPHTSDFAVLYVPTESLYAELMSHAGLADDLQREHRVMLAGPSNFLALLNVLQMGFRTVAIEHRSAEVWRTLQAVRTEFGKFGDVLMRAKRSLQAASNTIDEARGKTTTISRKLKGVEALPEAEAAALLELDGDGEVEPDLPDDDPDDVK